jgi:hypothetical protein
MPGINDHLDQVAHNQNFLRLLRWFSRFFPDWLVTAEFYTALHVVDAYLATNNIHPTTHTLRGQCIFTDLALRPIYREYQDLENLSRDVRYEVYTLTQQDLKDCASSLSVIQYHLHQLLV